jgi:hypothetical protein
MSVRPESYKIVMLIFYLSLWTKNICINKISAKKKYQHCKNNGFDKISLPAKYRHRKNIGFNKISVEIKVARYQIGGN